MSSELAVWHFLAGVALFIFAMHLLEKSLRLLAGRSFKKFLEKQTSSKFKAITAGAVATSILQSSSVVNLTVLSFVGAGLLSMKHALGMVMGANLGTTMSSWVIALLGFKLNLEYITYPILTFSLLGLLFSRNQIVKNLISFCIGFSLVFISIEWMKESAILFVDQLDFESLKKYSPYLFIPVGFILTALIQSSSAMMAITLTTVHTGSIDFIRAAGIVIGSELGTTVKVLIGALTGSTDKKRVAYGNFFFNVYTLILASVLLYPFTWLILDVIRIPDNLIALVIFQSGINLLSIFIFYPFMDRYTSWIKSYVKTNDNEHTTLYLNHVNPEETEPAVDVLYKELNHLFSLSLIIHRLALGIDKDEKQLPLFQSLRGKSIASYDEHYERLKILHGEILKYSVDASSHAHDTEQSSELIETVDIARNILRAAKNIKDIRHNIDELQSSANDTLFKQFQQLQGKEDEFINSIENQMSQSAEHPENQIKKNYESLVRDALHLLHEGKINEIEISSLMNIYREIYSAHKALLNAMEGLKAHK